MTTKKQSPLTELWPSLLALALVVPMAWWSGFVLVVLWPWFAEPLGAPAIESVWHASGVVLIVNWTTGTAGAVLYVSTQFEKLNKRLDKFRVLKQDPGDGSEDSSIPAILMTVGRGFYVPTVVLVLGWIYHALMQ